MLGWWVKVGEGNVFHQGSSSSCRSLLFFIFFIYRCELRKYRDGLVVDLVISLDVTFDHPSKDAF